MSGITTDTISINLLLAREVPVSFFDLRNSESLAIARFDSESDRDKPFRGFDLVRFFRQVHVVQVPMPVRVSKIHLAVAGCGTDAERINSHDVPFLFSTLMLQSSPEFCGKPFKSQ